MAFGFKVKSIKTTNKYTIATLYEAIKDQNFTAGKPMLAKHGMTEVIVFPPLDKRNQVWILGFGKKEGQKFVVQKGEAVGMGSMLKNSLVDDITGGATRLIGVLGGNGKECERLVDETAKELTALNL